MRYPHFDLQSTLASGQVFRWASDGDGFLVQHGNELFRVEQHGADVHFEGCSPEFFKKFFDWDYPYAKMLSALQKFPELQEPLAKYSGLRLLRQDPWECTASFICSAQSNIPRISKNVDSLAVRFGEKKKHGHLKKEYYAFPKIGKLEDANIMRKEGLGYRAKHLHEMNSMVDEKFFKRLAKMDYQEARKTLMTLPGVGPKVADCVCLFSLGHHEAFPVDVHIQRVMEGFFFDNKPQKPETIVKFARERYGKHAGYAQQFLFHAARKKTI
jgi:N-glycosylase/DNA lyase